MVAIILSASLSMAQTDVVSGNAKTYAGDTLRMYSIDDYITKNETVISTAIVDKDGNFSFNVRLREVTKAYIDLNVFKCMLYLKPNTKQTIILPEKQEIKPQDEVNPFFRKYEFYPKLINADPSDLNELIPAFDKLYVQAMNRIITSQYSFSKAKTDTLEAKIAAQLKSDDPFFQSYMRYRFAMLDRTAYRRNNDIIIKEYFAGKDVMPKNPAYNDLFDEIYTNVFANFKDMFASHNDKYQAIRDKSYHALHQSIVAEPKVSNDRLADYIILKGIKDAYYADTISKECLVALADSMAGACKSKDFRKMAENISGYFTQLMCGHQAPDFNISDMENKKYDLTSFHGKFTYLIFFNPNSYSAQSDLELIRDVRAEVPPEALNVVLVFVDQNKNQYTDFCNNLEEDLGFPIYWYNGDKEMLKKYEVRAFPTYYLINPDLMLAMKPAPSPTEGFLQKFDATFRSWKQEQMRKQYRENQGIK
ncbi:MAG: redoxin domain-containing protein [Bacteroidales bacterium]|nr:redoxin domain-containing protein [Bacteroidales bacterium]